MGKSRTAGRGDPPEPPAKQPLVETDGPLAIKLLEARYAEIEKLDPDATDNTSYERAEANIYADVGRVFGDDSAEQMEIWKHNRIVDEPEYLSLDGYNDSIPESTKRKIGIARMLNRLRALIDRAKELAELHSTQKGSDMNLKSVFRDMSSPFTLVKPNGDRAVFHGIRDPGKNTLQVHDDKFDGEAGDQIEFPRPAGKPEVCNVVTSSYNPAAIDPDLAHHIVKLAHGVPRPAAPAPAIHHYEITNSTIGAVGSNATVKDTTVISHHTQTWNDDYRQQLAIDLGKLRTALEAEDGDDAESELVQVAAASKALTRKDESGFKAAVKKLGPKALEIAQSIAVEVLAKCISGG